MAAIDHRQPDKVPVNLRGEKTGNPIPVKNNSFETEVGAYKPVTL